MLSCIEKSMLTVTRFNSTGIAKRRENDLSSHATVLA